MKRLFGKQKAVKLLIGDAKVAKCREFEMLLLQLSLASDKASLSTQLAIVLSELYDRTEDKLEYHAKSLETMSVEPKLFPNTKLTSQSSFILSQLVALNQVAALQVLFSPKADQFPALANEKTGCGALHDIIYQLLATHNLENDEQSDIHRNLWSILKIIRGKSDTKVRNNFDKAMCYQELRHQVQHEVLRIFQRNLKTISAKQVQGLTQFCDKIYDLFPDVEKTESKLTLVEGLKAIENAQVNVPEGIELTAHQLAIHTLYANIICAYTLKSPTQEALQWLLDTVRGTEGSPQRKSFEALWNDSAFGSVFIAMLKAALLQDFGLMIQQGDVSGMDFWKALLATLPTTTPGASFLLASVFAQTRVELQSEDGLAMSYNGWAEVLCAQSDYDWGKIDIKLLSQLVRWGAVVGSVATRYILGSLMTKIIESEAPALYLDKLVELMAALKGRRNEAEMACMLLFGTPVLTEAFDLALKTKNGPAVVAMLQTDFFTEFAPLLSESITNNTDNAIWLLVAVTDHTKLSQKFVQWLQGEKLWPATHDLIVRKSSTQVILPLQRGNLSDGQLEALIVAMMHRNPIIINTLYSIIGEQPGDGPKRQSLVLAEGKMRDRLNSATEKFEQDSSAAAASNPGEYVVFDNKLGALKAAIGQQKWADVCRELQNVRGSFEVEGIEQLLKVNGYEKSSFQDAINQALADAKEQQQLRGTLKKAQDSFRKSKGVEDDDANPLYTKLQFQSHQVQLYDAAPTGGAAPVDISLQKPEKARPLTSRELAIDLAISDHTAYLGSKLYQRVDIERNLGARNTGSYVFAHMINETTQQSQLYACVLVEGQKDMVTVPLDTAQKYAWRFVKDQQDMTIPVATRCDLGGENGLETFLDRNRLVFQNAIDNAQENFHLYGDDEDGDLRDSYTAAAMATLPPVPVGTAACSSGANPFAATGPALYAEVKQRARVGIDPYDSEHDTDSDSDNTYERMDFSGSHAAGQALFTAANQQPGPAPDGALKVSDDHFGNDSSI